MVVPKGLVVVGVALLVAAMAAPVSPIGQAAAAHYGHAGAGGGPWCFSALPVPDRVDFAQANDVNNRGFVVGAALEAGGSYEAVVWWRGRFRVLPDDGAVGSVALAVNAHNVIAGLADDHPVVWRKGRMRLLSDYGIANDINDRGVVVGASGNSLPTVWSRGEEHVLRGGELGIYGEIRGVDDAGLMAGNDGVSPLAWRHGSVNRLATPTGTEYGIASAVNSGVIVGQANVIGARSVPLVWRDLKPSVLPFQSRPGDAAWTSDVNSHGLIVGGKTPSGQSSRAVAWVHGRYQVLPSPRGSDVYATGVNDNGLIVGTTGLEAALWSPAPRGGCS